MRKPRLLSERETNTLTGKALVGAMTREDQLRLCEHLNLVYARLDDADLDDALGTEGWRHYVGLPDSDR